MSIMPMGARNFTLLALLSAAFCGCGRDEYPRWDRDGRRIVYVRPNGELRLLDLESAAPPALLTTGASSPRWSAIGRRVYFLRQDRLFSVRVDGLGEREHASNVAWFEPDPEGRRIWFLNASTLRLSALDLVTGQIEHLTREGGRVRAVAVESRGQRLAYAAESSRGGEKGYSLRLIESSGLNRVLVEHIPAAVVNDEVQAPSVAFRPATNEVMLFPDKDGRLWSADSETGASRTIPIRHSGTLEAYSLTPDGSRLNASGVGRDGQWYLGQLDLASGQFQVIETSKRPLGVPGWYGADAEARLTESGLMVSDSRAGWTRYFPTGTDEYAAAATSYLDDGLPKRTLALVDEAVYSADPLLDRQKLAMLGVEAHLALEDRAAAGETLMDAVLSHPITSADPSAVWRMITDLRADNSVLDILHKASIAEPIDRTNVLVRATPLLGGKKLLAGLEFHMGLADSAVGRHRDAARRFRIASEEPSFPAADWAAGLAAGAQFVWGRSDRYAEELLMRTLDRFPNSPLVPDYRKAIDAIRGAGSLLRRSEELRLPGGGEFWIAERTLRSMGALFTPSRDDPRRLRLDITIRSEAWLGGGGERLLHSTLGELGSPSVSPDGRTLVFLERPRGEGSWTRLHGVDLAADGPRARVLIEEAVPGIVGLAWKIGDMPLELELEDGSTREAALTL